MESAATSAVTPDKNYYKVAIAPLKLNPRDATRIRGMELHTWQLYENYKELARSFIEFEDPGARQRLIDLYKAPKPGGCSSA